MPEKPGQTGYHDGVIRFVLAFIAAHIVTEYGGQQPWLTRVFSIDYYIEYGSTLAITILDIHIVYWVTLQLDRKFSWLDHPVFRGLLQVAFGLLLPTLITFLLAAGYFRLYGMDILDTNYHLYALPFISSLIALFNVYYLVRYLLREREHYWQMVLQSDRDNSMVAPATMPAPEPGMPLLEKSVFIVHTPTRSFPVATGDIAYFYREEGQVYLRAFAGNKHILSQSLEQIEEQLNKDDFFRVARHMIASRAAVRGYEKDTYGKLSLKLEPTPEYKRSITISQNKAGKFREWLDR
ncbi:LytTr DNA-binding domain-containing protein [Chitinophaga eiseniae]|uniref:LytTr DNA-binding domain-containing protein n=1 Tax=Chitinophaga eiseniae TaxID=634771 RepID=A0A1T4SXG4_9BACT|nr:LytTR family DNA-binding domain-containing protein [Chitinophaga eiseniae]SKA32893.1 LytTr DNA-binding domain-containing protein [Chitinophaga eiseniae]